MSNFSTKIASTASVVALVATAMSASLVSAASEFLPYAELLADNSVIGVQTNEAGYRLGDAITRGELAKITANVGGLTAVEPTGTVFGDVSAASVGDLAGYIEALAEAGIVSTANANFRPKANVTRAEAVKLLLGALGEEGSSVDAGYTDIANLGDLAMYINRANELGVIADGTYFRPNASITRGEAFKIAANAAKDVLTTTPTTPTTPTTSGSTTVGALTVALDGVAAAQYVPKNASSVKVGTVKVTAGTTDVTVNSLTINRSGLGNSTDLTVSIGQNGTTVSESRSVNSATQDAIVRLNAPVTVKAGTSASFDVLASFGAGAAENNQHQFTLKAVGTTAAVTGTPVTLGLLNTTSYEVSKLKVLSVIFGGVTSGKNDQSLGKVKLQAGTKDATLSAFTLSKTAGIDLTRAISNVKVLKNGVAVGTASVTSDKIYVTGLNTKLARQDSAEFELRADVIYVGAGLGTDDVTLAISETTDISAVEDITGYATMTDLPAQANNVTYSVIDLSSLDIVWTKNTTKSVTVAPGASNVVLFDAKLTSSASFDITKITVAESPTSINDLNESENFSSLTLTVNGIDYDLLTTSQSSLGTYEFAKTSDKFRIDTGAAVNVRLTANLTNKTAATVATGSLTALRSYQFNVTVNDVKNISNGTTVAGLNKASGNGDKVTVSAPTLKVGQSSVSAPSSAKIYSNATGLEVGRFSLEATAEEVTVREITLVNATGTTTPTANFTQLISGTNVRLVNVADNTQVSATVAVVAGNIKFTGMSIKIAKDTKSNFKVVMDTQGDLTTTFVGGTNDDLALSVAVPAASSSSASSINVTPYDTTKIYSVAVIPPTVTLVKKSANVYLLKVTNADADIDVTVSEITAQVRPVSVANSSYKAATCIRTEGSSDKCTYTVDVNGNTVPSSTIGAVPGAANTFVLAAPVVISKNSNITREIYVDSNFVSPSDLQAEITKAKYYGTVAGAGTAVEETYSVIAQ